jgi:ATP-dependent RNA helicase DDX31/DBP7
MTAEDAGLGDLNIVAIPVQPKAQPIKKKKNNKYERRRRKALNARQAQVNGNADATTTNPAKSPIVNKVELPKPALKELPKPAPKQNTADKAPAIESRNEEATEESLGNAISTLVNKERDSSPNKADEKEKPITAANKSNMKSPKAKSKKSAIEKETEKTTKSKIENPTEKTTKSKIENPAPVKASRRHRAQPKEDEVEQEEDHAKYMAEFHARPMELDRRSGARSSIRISKASSHLFVADNWESLQINSRLIQTLTSKFELAKPTSIQTKTIQVIQSSPKNNVLVHSETGSGKTLAYLLPILQSLAFGDVAGTGEPKKKTRKELGTKCIILCPTRELASQTLQVLERLCQANFAGWIVPGGVLGGDSRQSEKSRLRKGLAIVVATPGRLLDHLQKTESLLLNLKGKLQWLVLDEADRLLDMGLGDQVRQIVQIIRSNEASKSQSWWRSVLVSATVTESVQELAKERMLCGDQEWVWVKAGGEKSNASSGQKDGKDAAEKDSSLQKEDSMEGYSESTPRQLAQFHLTVTAKLRLSTLVAFLVERVAKGERVVVFMGTCASVDYHYQLFEYAQSLWGMSGGKEEKGLFGNKAQVFKLHGSVAHSKRSKTLQNFEAVSSSAILLTTDVSARGLNLQGVNWIVQYDPPCEISDYVHRVGRVARAGRAGQSLLFLLPSEQAYIDVLKTKGIVNVTALSLSSTLNQAASVCKDLTSAGMKNGGGGSGGQEKTNQSSRRGSNRLGEYFALEIQRNFEDCVVQDDIQAKKEAKKAKKDSKRKRKGESPKIKEGLLLELARDAFVSFLRAYATKKEAAVRSIFSARALHVGHVARSFALKEPPKSLVSKHRQNKKEQQQEVDDAEANKPKSLAFNSSRPAKRSDDGKANEDEEQQETRTFKRPKRIHSETEASKAKHSKALLLANAAKMQSNLMDAM